MRILNIKGLCTSSFAQLYPSLLLDAFARRIKTIPIFEQASYRLRSTFIRANSFPFHLIISFFEPSNCLTCEKKGRPYIGAEPINNILRQIFIKWPTFCLLRLFCSHKRSLSA